LEADINISYKTVKEARVVADAIAPDNATAPQGLSVRTNSHGVKVSTKIMCQTKLETFIATIDDLLSAISVAEKSLSTVKKR